MCHVFSVHFKPCQQGEWQDLDAVLDLGGDSNMLGEFVRAGIRFIAIFIDRLSEQTKDESGVLKFENALALDPRLRNQCLHECDLNQIYPLALSPGDSVLALNGKDPVWGYRHEKNSSVDLISGVPDEIGEGGYLFEHLNAKRFAKVLPLFHFLRRVTEDSGWQYPALRAAIMFDDPNLHWTSYGYVDFEKIASDARKIGYHVTMAMIPLDSWYAHSSAVRIFHEYQDELSFLIHGNNHLHKELAQEYGEARQVAILAQCLKRIDKLEERTGISISRIMAAPHGACRENMMRSMLHLGFEGACISNGSLWGYNDISGRSPTIGIDMATILAGGFPVIKRFGLSKQAQNEIVLAAFLNQPIIPVGHHEDLSEGIGILSKTAERINRLGNVKWSNIADIMASNFCIRQEREELRIRCYSRRVRLKIPQGVESVVVEAPTMGQESIEHLEVANIGKETNKKCTIFAIKEPIHVQSSDLIEIRLVTPNAIDPYGIPTDRTPLWAVVRRMLTEARDRSRLFN